MNNGPSFFEGDARELFDNAPCGYVSSLLDGTIVLVNQTFLDWTGYKREDLLCFKKFQDLLTVPGQIFYETQFSPLVQMQGFVKEIVFDVVCPSRENLPCLINSQFHPASGDRPAFLRTTFFDATARRRYERDLLESRRALEEMVKARTAALEREIADRSKAEESLKQLTTRLLQLRDDERRRIARDLHDSTGQLLSATVMNLDVAAKESANLSPRAAAAMAESYELVREALKEIRVVSYLLHPPLLDEAGLGSALEWFLDGFSKRGDVDARLEVEKDFGRLPMAMETALFRIVQECMTNIHRHSGSKTAVVKLSRTPNEVRVEVSDHGHGMPEPAMLGVGLRGMKERIRQFGGAMEIASSSAGTVIVARIPGPVGERADDPVPFS